MRLSPTDIMQIGSWLGGMFRGRKARKIIRRMELAGVVYHEFREARDEVIDAAASDRGAALNVAQTKALAYLFRQLGQ